MLVKLLHSENARSPIANTGKPLYVFGIMISVSSHVPLYTVYPVFESFNSYFKPSLGVLSIGSGVTGVTLLEPLPDIPESDIPESDVPVSDIPVSDVPVSEVPVSNVPVSEVFVSDVPVSEVPVSDVIELSSTEPVDDIDDIDEVAESEVVVGEESSALVSPQAEQIPSVKVAKNATAATNIFLFISTSPCSFLNLIYINKLTYTWQNDIHIYYISVYKICQE
jgi:hypothetical protein